MTVIKKNSSLNSNVDLSGDEFLMFHIDQIANKLEAAGSTDVIRMTLGKSDLLLSPEISQVMSDAIFDRSKNNLTLPPGLPQLRTAVASLYSTRRADVKDSDVVITQGTSPLFRNLFQLLAKSGDEILLPKPYYCLYTVSAKLFPGVKVKFYTIDPNTREIDMESFTSALTNKTKIVVLNSPGNPLGNIIQRETMEKIDRLVNGRATIISDEIYVNMGFDGPVYSVLDVPSPRCKYVVTNSCSKAYRMYCRRVGWCVAPNQPELIHALIIMQEHTMLTVDPVVQFGALKALEMGEEVDFLRGIYKKRRDYAYQTLGKLDLIEPIYPEGGFYITLNCDKFMKKANYRCALSLAESIIYKTHVATVPGTDFGFDRSLRLSFSAKEFEVGIDRLYQFFNSVEY